MLRVVSSGLWRIVGSKARHASVRRAAIAYVGKSPPIRFGEGDLLVVDASDASIKAGRTSAKVLRAFQEAGAELYSQPNLHAKVMLLDDWVVVGSANASQNSYIEAALITDRIDIAGQVERLIDDLAKPDKRITQGFLKRILALPVAERPFGGQKGRRTSAPVVTGPRTWLVSLRGDADYPGDEEHVDEVSEEEQIKVGRKAGEMDWFFAGPSGYGKARVGDILIECWRPQNKILSTRSVRVYPPARLLRIYKERGVNSKTFHLLLPPKADRAVMSWSKFQDLAKRAGIQRQITYRSNIALTEQQSAALQELWPR